MSKNIKTKLCAIAIAAALAVSFSLTGCNDSFKKTESGQPQTSDSSVVQVSNAESKFGDNIAAKSEHYTISLPMIKRIFKNSYNSFTTYYASSYGFDTTKSSKTQYYDEENKITWYDQFIDSAKNEVIQLFTLCETAQKEGITIDDEDRKDIDKTLDQMRTAASEAGTTVDEYISSTFGEGLTEKDVLENLEQTTLASKYYKKIYDGFTYTDEQYEKTYNENKESYQYVDFLTFTFGYGAKDSSESSVTIDEAQKEKAKKAAEELAKVKSEQEFKDYITKYLKENPDYVNISAENSYSQEEFDAAVTSQVNSALKQKYAYEKTTDAGKWMFDDTRKVNETYLFEGTSSYSVVMLLKTPYRDESILKNVRHILIASDADGSDEEAKKKADEEAKKKADEVYEEWKNGEATEETFAALATEYNATSDPNSAASGGLYEDVYQGEMVPTFNDWVFDASRKPGDTGIVKTDYGYHIMYFVGDSIAAWKSSIDAVMRRDDYSKKYEELKKAVTIDFDDDYINTILDPVEEAAQQEENSEESSESSVENSTESKPESSAENSVESKSESIVESSVESAADNEN